MVWMLQPYHIHRLDYIHSSIYFMICLHYYSLTILTPLCLKKLLANVGILQPYNIHILYYIHSSIYLMCWIHYYNLTILTPWCLNKLACQKWDITTLPNSQPLLYSSINIFNMLATSLQPYNINPPKFACHSWDITTLPYSQPFLYLFFNIFKELNTCHAIISFPSKDDRWSYYNITLFSYILFWLLNTFHRCNNHTLQNYILTHIFPPGLEAALLKNN